ncbi:MAG: ATP-binding cassette domain-containing protein, partial [Gemmatimonadales bacterium]
MSEPLLVLNDLRTYFHDGASVARAVDGVSLDVVRGETVAVVGESGSGKSVTALSILRLIRSPGRIEANSSVVFEGRELLELGESEMRNIRGNRIAMIFQEPMSALNPVLTVGDQIAEVVRVHTDASRHEAWERAVEMLALTGMSEPRERATEYPHQMSGGMRQRVMIA